jgi:hypothetical protein
VGFFYYFLRAYNGRRGLVVKMSASRPKGREFQSCYVKIMFTHNIPVLVSSLYKKKIQYSSLLQWTGLVRTNRAFLQTQFKVSFFVGTVLSYPVSKMWEFHWQYRILIFVAHPLCLHLMFTFNVIKIKYLQGRIAYTVHVFHWMPCIWLSY